METKTLLFIKRAVMLLLVAVCCSASALAFSTRTVTLKAGDGTGSDIVISSDDAANVASDFHSSSPGQFYEENGTVYYRVPFCPDSFVAPAGKVFAGWLGDETIYPGYVITASGNMTLTAQWVDSGDAKLLTIIPSVGKLNRAFDPEWADYTLNVPYTGSSQSVTVTAIPRDPAATVRYGINNPNGNDTTCPSIEGSSVAFIIVTNGSIQETYYINLSILYSISVITQGRGTAKTYSYYGGEETNTGGYENLIQLKATPATGWHFVRWEKVSGNGTLTNELSQYDGRYRIGTDNAVIRAVFTSDNPDVALNDTGDNSATLASLDGSLANVTLQGRTLVTDGNWNTLCLPFDVPDLTGTPLEGFTVVELDTENKYKIQNSKFIIDNVNGTCRTGFEDGTLYLNFKTASSIVAGKPYLVKKVDTTQDTSTPTYTPDDGTAGINSSFGYANLISGSTNNYWRTAFPNTDGTYCEFHTPKAMDVTGYVLTSGNMATTYDPKVWVLKAKRNPSDAWTVIDSRNALENASDALPSSRTTAKTYTLDADKQGTYQYFRFEVTQNGGASYMVLCNLALQGSYAPDAVNVTNPVFEVVTIDATAPTPVTSQDGKVSFVGSFSPVSFAADSLSVLRLDAENILRHASAGTSLGACRVLFQLNDGVLAGSSAALPRGDIDGDGQVTIADVTAVVNIVLGNAFTSARVRLVDGNGELEYK